MTAARPGAGDSPGPVEVTRDLAAFGDDSGWRLFVDSGLLALAVLRDGRLLRVTPEFLQLFGLPADAGAHALDALAALLLGAVAEGEAGGGARRVLCPVRIPSGETRTVELRVARGPLQGRPALALVAGDVTDQAREYRRLHFLAMHDPLTGLPNRALMRDRLERAVAADRRHGHGCAVLLVDLDGFKHVNDQHGHAVGDALLQVVAERLQDCSRQSDAVARFGGDEFVVVASPIGGNEEAALIAARMVTELETPFDVDGVRVQIGASVGIAVRGEAQEDADLLLSEADAAMYLAKGEGKSRYAFPQVDREMLKATRDIHWPADLQVGIAQVDREHEELSEGMNALLARVRGDADPETLARGLGDLLVALGRHFATEERHMRAHPSSWDDEHRDEHRRVMDDLRRLTVVVTDQSVALAIRYLHQWLSRHAASYDQRLGEAGGHGAGRATPGGR